MWQPFRWAPSSTAWYAWTLPAQVIRDALLWNDTRLRCGGRQLVDELGGPAAWAQRIGVVPVASITATKLRWLADHEPRNADATAAVCLPHDWLTWRLSGSTDIADLRTDRSDASGTGYFSPRATATSPICSSLRCGGEFPCCQRYLDRATQRAKHRRAPSSVPAPATTPLPHWDWTQAPATAWSRSGRPVW